MHPHHTNDYPEFERLSRSLGENPARFLRYCSATRVTDLTIAILRGIAADEDRQRLEGWIRAEHELCTTHGYGRRRAVERHLGQMWADLVGRGEDLTFGEATTRAKQLTERYETVDEVRDALADEVGGHSRKWVIAALNWRLRTLQPAQPARADGGQR